MKQSYSGSCHCGAIRFEAAIDLAPPGERSRPDRDGVWYTTTFRCNCSYCAKTRYWKAFVSAVDFRWVSGQETAGNYQFAGREIDHHFCATCGVQPFMRSSLDSMFTFTSPARRRLPPSRRSQRRWPAQLLPVADSEPCRDDPGRYAHRRPRRGDTEETRPQSRP
jgi:hypothetical protein